MVELIEEAGEGAGCRSCYSVLGAISYGTLAERMEAEASRFRMAVDENWKREARADSTVGRCCPLPVLNRKKHRVEVSTVHTVI